MDALTKRRGNLDAVYCEASGLAQILNDPLLPFKETLQDRPHLAQAMGLEGL
jgi:hypothetical protein